MSSTNQLTYINIEGKANCKWSKRNNKLVRLQTAFFVFDKFTLQNLADKSGGVKKPFILFIHHTWWKKIWCKQYYQTLFVYRIDLGQNLLFLALFIPKILQFFTIFQDKIDCAHSIFRTIEARTRFPCTTNYRTVHIFKRFHEENSTMLGLFSQINVLPSMLVCRVIMGF